MNIDHPALRYTGGKWRDAKWIISHFPKHDCYVEPYCGGASVLLRKEPSYFEVMNDLDQDVINFFKVLRENYDEFIRLIQFTPWSRQELSSKITETDSSLERARKFYISSWQGRQGGWRFQYNPSNGYSIISQWNDQSHLESVVKRLKNVQFDCDEALRVIKRYDAPDTLFYIDPPYVLNTRRENIYKHEMTDVDHIALWELLYNIKGKVVLSGYPSDLYCKYGKEWKTDQKLSKTIGTKFGTEMLWMNF